MGYFKTLDEYDTATLLEEIQRRERLRAARRCSYCERPYKTSTCMFPDRHSGKAL